ncbi:MAG: serine hydrolase [Acidobacteriota bacterium]
MIQKILPLALGLFTLLACQPPVAGAARPLKVTEAGSRAVQQVDLPAWPQQEWQRAATPELLGWSSSRLDAARAYAEDIGTQSFLLIDRGVVVQQWGDVTKPYQVYSIRKSLVSALVGMALEETDLRLDNTLEDLAIDDDPPLDQGEKQARLADLLSSRSGVYHRAAYEAARHARNRPQRGAHRPGDFFYYNNWDFNALGTIVSRALGGDLFELMQRRLAEPLGMQDFSLERTEYRREKASRHPAYLLEMSARDLARFGLLYLRRGSWREQRLLTADWVDLSTRTHSPGATENRGYGYLWWTYPRYGSQYAASGSGGQLVLVLPDRDLVMVHLARENAFGQGGVEAREFWQLFGRVMAAKDSASAESR